jgi:hypothetical protein
MNAKPSYTPPPHGIASYILYETSLLIATYLAQDLSNSTRSVSKSIPCLNALYHPVAAAKSSESDCRVIE